MRVATLFILCASALFLSSTTSAKDLQDLIDLPVEVHETLKSRFAESKEYTEAQLETITRCLDKGDVERIINCLSDDGLDDAVAIGYLIRDEMGNLKDRVCRGSSLLEQDRCRKLQNDVNAMGTQIKEKWSKTLDKGKAYLEKRYELTRLKKRICDRINDEGCWRWLNDRLDIHCKPSSLDNDPEKLRQCRLDIANDVWNRLEAKQ